MSWLYQPILPTTLLLSGAATIAVPAGSLALTGLPPTVIASGETSASTNGGVPDGQIARNLKRVAEENRQNKKIADEALEKRAKLTLKRIVDGAPQPSKELKRAYRDVGSAQKELHDAEQKLIAFLELQEAAASNAEEEIIIKIIMEML
jgi:hypothetical protein